MSMKIKVENLELTDALMSQINIDLKKLEKFDIKMTDINVFLEKKEGLYHVEYAILSQRFGKIESVAEEPNLIEALQMAFKRFETQMIKDKEKQVSHR